MKVNLDVAGRQKMNFIRNFAGLALALVFLAPLAVAQSEPTETKPAERKTRIETYQTINLNYATTQNDLTDVQTALRNLLPNLRIYAVAGQNAISMRATAEEFQLAQKIIADLDRPKKVYRLTFTLTDTEVGKRVEVRHLVLIVTSGEKTTLKQGDRVPYFGGADDAKSAAKSIDPQNGGAVLEYADLGLTIEATVDGNPDFLRLRSRISRSSLANDRSIESNMAPQIRQTILEGSSLWKQGKPLILGSFDLPGGTRKEEVEVVAELVK